MKILTKNENTKPPPSPSYPSRDGGYGGTEITTKAPPKRKEKKIKMKMRTVMEIKLRKIENNN